MSTTRRIRGENRFYNPPAIRKLQQEREKKRLEEQEAQEKNKAKEITLDRQKKEEEKRPLPSPDECSTSDDCSVPGRVGSNLGRFLDCTTPVVRTQYLPLVI